MEQHIAEVRAERALHHAIPPATSVTYERGNEVLVWREKLANNRVGEWVGPFIVDL